jgi:hypothetical protein
MKGIIIILIILIIYLFNKKSSFTYNQFINRFTTNNNQGTIKGVDMVYAITMDQRREYITSQIDKLNVKCKYLDAITPEDLSESEYSSLSTTNERGSRIYNKKTRLPVLLSFITCFMDAIKNGYTTIIVFEDDIVMDTDILTLNETTDQFSKSDLEFLYLGYCFLNCNQKFEEIGNLKILSDPSLLCGHAMCVKVNSLQPLIDYCFPMKKPSDELFMDYYKKAKSKVCVPVKPYFNQLDRSLSGSLNESTIELKYCQ